MALPASPRPLATWWLREQPERPIDIGYWRAHVPARALPGAVRFLHDDSFPGAQEGETAIFVLPTSYEELEAIEQARELGLRTLVDTDDNWVDAPASFLATKNTPYDAPPEIFALIEQAWESRLAQHREAAAVADGVIVSCPALATMYAAVNANVFVCRSSLPAEWGRARGPGDGVFRVGFAGSHGHAEDLHLIRDSLEWASAQDGVEAVSSAGIPWTRSRPPIGGSCRRQRGDVGAATAVAVEDDHAVSRRARRGGDPAAGRR